MIAGRFHGTSFHGNNTSTNSTQGGGGVLYHGAGGGGVLPPPQIYTIDPRIIASEIVREYKENLEQAESGLFGDEDVDDDEGGLGLAASANNTNGNLSYILLFPFK